MSDVELTLIANVALDRVNRGPWTGGGCPTFAPYVFASLGAGGAIVTACAPADRPAFAPLEHTQAGVSVRFVDATTTSRFGLDYTGGFGETRSMVIHAIGHAWSQDDVDRLRIESEWVHLAPLARSDFPVATVARLAARGHRISYDGQGLVRVPQTGPMRLDAAYDPALLDHLAVLKLSEDEMTVLAAGREPAAVLEELSVVPELLLTLGPRGAEVHAAGSPAGERVDPPEVVADVQTTGAGDAFMIGYVVARERGRPPAAAAAAGAAVAAAMLRERKVA